tara:strand:+ start:60 stop:737 length:678 start_codon:yes stop_codon:yes gene_type:complete
MLTTIAERLKSISIQEKDNLSEACNCIQRSSAKSGRGLSTGEKVDFFVSQQFFPSTLGLNFQEYHENESDFKISGHPVSFKTLRDGGDLAMCWSRNDDKRNTRIIKECNHWQVPILIYVRESKKWWENGPQKDWLTKNKIPKDEKKWWTNEVSAGFYLIDHVEARSKIILDENNKTGCLLKKMDVYRLIMYSKKNNLFVPMPEPKGKFSEMKFVFLDSDGNKYGE